MTEPPGGRYPDDDQDDDQEDGEPARPAAEPTLDEIAALWQVEHILDQRWPETKIAPSTIRIDALMEMLGSPSSWSSS